MVSIEKFLDIVILSPSFEVASEIPVMKGMKETTKMPSTRVGSLWIARFCEVISVAIVCLGSKVSIESPSKGYRCLSVVSSNTNSFRTLKSYSLH